MSWANLPTFDELYALSDIHMGGRQGFQILKHGPRLGALIEHLATVRPGGSVALVLNGDVIDSLAEDLDGYVAMEEAERMMDRIYNDETFRPIWEGLAKFTAAANRHLIVVGGNHDIELALPQVEGWIRNRLSDGQLERHARIHFATHGTGFGCQVGAARVFCTHGNEVDGWNLVDHERLAQLGNALNAGRRIDRKDWTPNAGTRMVVDVMNQIKADYPFVDLLKPETKPVLGVLLVIAPELVKSLKLEDVASIGKDLIRGTLVKRGLLSADAVDVDQATDLAAAAEIAIPELLGGELREALQASIRTLDANADDLLLEVEEDFVAGKSDIDRDDSARKVETLGVMGMIADRIRGIDKVDALRRALLDWLKDDKTYDLHHKDELFREIVDRVGPEVDFVITGHSHLERAIRIDEGFDRFYFNCGTWIRLIRFTDSLLNDPVAFRQVYDVLQGGSIEAIDSTTIPDSKTKTAPLVLDRTAVVHISSEDDGVVGRLYRAQGVDDGVPVSLSLVPGSECKVKRL